jgi:hypothetical protein
VARSNGEFPGFEKIDLDADTTPKNYWDSNRRCPTCNTCWPDVETFNPAPCHPDVETVRENGAPDMRWETAIKRFHECRFEHYYNEWNEDKSDEQLALEDVTTNGEIDEEKLKQEIGRFLDRIAP